MFFKMFRIIVEVFTCNTFSLLIIRSNLTLFLKSRISSIKICECPLKHSHFNFRGSEAGPNPGSAPEHTNGVVKLYFTNTYT